MVSIAILNLKQAKSNWPRVSKDFMVFMKAISTRCTSYKLRGCSLNNRYRCTPHHWMLLFEKKGGKTKHLESGTSFDPENPLHF